MELVKLSTQEAFPFYKKLYSKVKKDYYSFNNFDMFNLKLFKGDYKLLKNRFNSTVFACIKDNTPMALITHYQAKDSSIGEANTLGSILIDNRLSDEDLTIFCIYIKAKLKHIKGPILGPYNAHPHLGLSHPEIGTDPKKITIFTAASSPAIDRFFALSDFFEKHRTFYSYVNKIDNPEEEFKKIDKYFKEHQLTSEFSTRTISFFNLKRDIGIYTSLIQKCFLTHFSYFPLTEDEEYDLMKSSALIVNKKYFRFLVHKGKEVALSWFMIDYNQCLKNGQDIRNVLRILFYKLKATRTRGIYAGILPEYQGKNLMKQVRQRSYKQMLKDGIVEFESSYIDQDNINSILYTKSNGHQLSHCFYLYNLKK